MKANDLFTQITDQLIADIEAGAGSWRMPWHTSPTPAPQPVSTGDPTGA